MYWYLAAALLATWAFLSIEYTRQLIRKYKNLVAQLEKKTSEGFYSKPEIDAIVEEQLEEKVEDQAIIEMVEAVKSGVLEVAGMDGIMVVSQEEYERLEKCDQLIIEMNSVKKHDTSSKKA